MVRPGDTSQISEYTSFSTLSIYNNLIAFVSSFPLLLLIFFILWRRCYYSNMSPSSDKKINEVPLIFLWPLRSVGLLFSLIFYSTPGHKAMISKEIDDLPDPCLWSKIKRSCQWIEIVENILIKFYMLALWSYVGWINMNSKCCRCFLYPRLYTTKGRDRFHWAATPLKP